jgi:hypothetical protein
MEDTNMQGDGMDTNQDTSLGDGVDTGSTEGETSQPEVNGGEAEGGADASAEATQNEEIVEQEGKKFIPYERFTQINERLKKAEESANFLESIKNDPVARQEFAKSLGLDKPAAQPDAKTQPSPTQKFLTESVDPKYQPHYSALFEAIGEEFTPYVQQAIEEAIAPFRAALGAMKLKEVESKIPDFNKHEKAVADLMRKHPTLDAETAYKIAAFDMRFKQGQTTGMQKAKTLQQKVSKTPIQRSAGGSAVTNPDKVKTMRDAMERAWTKSNGNGA